VPEGLLIWEVDVDGTEVPASLDIVPADQSDVMLAVKGALDDPFSLAGILSGPVREVSPRDQGALFADWDGWNDLK